MTLSIRDWAGLPEHLLDLIVTKFSLLSDYFSFAAVCSKWRNLNPTTNFFDILKMSRKEIPMLMIKTEENNDESRGLYNVLNGITYNIQLPLPYKYRFIGSSRGWLFCFDKNLVITLLNPFNNACISLPIFEDARRHPFEEEWFNEHICGYYLKKAILTFDPHKNPNNYEVVVIYHGMERLAYHKSDRQCWKFINLVREQRRHLSVDIICYGGCIYSVTYQSELLQIDFNSGTAKTVVPASNEEDGDGFYLVESQDGELFLVKRFWSIHQRDDGVEFVKTFNFEVFRLAHSCENEFATWDKIDNIGNQALFLGGGSHSVSVSTNECMKFHPNSIYYTPQTYLLVVGYEDLGDDEDSGIFNLGDKSYQSLRMLGLSKKYVQPPMWFVPNLK